MTAPQPNSLITVNCKVDCLEDHYFVAGTFQCRLSPTFDYRELDTLVAEIERAGQDFKRQLTKHVLEAADQRVAAVAQSANPILHKHGSRPFTIVARYGEVVFQRQRLFHPTKKEDSTLIPSAIAWKTSKRRHLTADLLNAACKESQQVSYRKAKQNLADTAGLETLISTSTVWNKKQQRGKELKATQKQVVDKIIKQHETMLVEHNIVPSLPDPSPEEVELFSLTSEQEEDVEELFQFFAQQEQTVPEAMPSVPQESAVEFVPKSPLPEQVDDVILTQLDEVMTKSQEEGCKTNLTYTGTVENRQGRVVYLVAESAEVLLRLVAAQLILFGLFSGKRLEVLSDGARWIVNWSMGLVGIEVVRVLCWYHLCKRVYEGLSGLGLSKSERKELEREILGYFWRGEHCLAIWKLWGLRDKARKEGRHNWKRLDDLIGYLLRKKGGLVNYSERRERGEWIASTRVEKWNDIAVAERCKHRGCSWTRTGVLAIATYAEKEKEKHTNS